MARTQTTPATDVTLVAGGAASAGDYTVLEVRAPVGAGLPPHVTSRADVVLLVLEGRLAAVVGERRRILETGDAIDLPRSVPRRLSALADLRLLCLASPAGLEQLIDVIAQPGVDPDDRAALLAAAGIALLPAAWGTSGVSSGVLPDRADRASAGS